MGASFCAVFEADVPPHGTLGGDHPALLRRQRRLDRLAAAAGLTPLGAFESYDPADAAGYLGEGDEPPADLPPVRWFPAAAGLAAVRALAAHLAAHPDAVSGPPEVASELEGLAGELADAERAGVRFRFAVVP
ncbi:hypothetical protein GobsT_11220 [Gemmata obscuriglobus]|uniref:Uncharacterized protein n=1 Tax=Gemmata obscuriglobus TaxID=114 RepID=A0A2Z3HA27_9BACT|nr:hypothetical protein [Gemmata obscuriglobus]AWM40387.1 hypothetical protein C1280_27620 [Gemmata obscuriglobus]QEG26383.1 hypothetical protein GobsT_11220 [Gemmata obscuriglobus]VTS01439.1 unnamed protein product [Gemmata obscuriglobus UQM 2246]